MAILSRELEGREFWYENILMPPVESVAVSPHGVDLSTIVSRNIPLKVPIVGSPMDTVTEAELAKKLALLGGIGVLHSNYGNPGDNIEKRIGAQAGEVRKVKRFENGFVTDPIVLSPDHTIEDYRSISAQTGISRFPITEDGTLGSAVVGLITKSDVRFVKDPSVKLGARMTPLKDLVIAPASETIDNHDMNRGLSRANDYIEERRIHTLLVMTPDQRLRAIVTASDLEKNLENPLATKDDKKRLRVLAAVGTRLESQPLLRMEALASAGVDGFVFDTAVYNKWGGEIIRQTRGKYPEQDFIIGNFATGRAIREVLDYDNYGMFIDGIRIGVGPGGGCTTQGTTGIGRPQGSAVYDCAQAVRSLSGKFGRIGIIADGGASESGHIALALGLGADSVMLGKMLAGYEESPAKRDPRTGKKIYMGMASPAAMLRGGTARYDLESEIIRAPEGFETPVDYLGPIEGREQGLPVVLAAIRQGFSKLNCGTISDLHGNDNIEIVYLPIRK